MQLATGSGQDLTLQFDWIDGKYAFNSTYPQECKEKCAESEVISIFLTFCEKKLKV